MLIDTPPVPRFPGSILAWFVFILVLRSLPAMAIEEPGYQLIEKDGDFSLRRYAPSIIAMTTVAGSLDQASSVGFRRLAGYIFGGNHPSAVNHPQPDRTDAAVTRPTPVKIAMTAPVTTRQQGNGWIVNFTMPARYTLAKLPVPDDGRITLTPIPEMTASVITFSGWVDDAKIADKTTALRAWMTSHRITATGDARLARYDPPWTLPFLRRNEILIPCNTGH